MRTAPDGGLPGDPGIDEIVRWGWQQYRTHLELLYPFAVFGIFSFLLELRVEFLTELYDLDEGLQPTVDAEVAELLSGPLADVLIPVLEDVVWLLVLGVFAIVLLTILAGLVAVGIAFLVTADALDGRERTQLQRTRRTLERLPALFAASVVASVLVGAGLLLLVVPGLYLAVKFALAGPAIVIDGSGPLAGLRTSWRVVSVQFQSVLSLVVPGIVILALSTLLPVIGEVIAVLVILPVLSVCLAFLYARPQNGV